MGAGPYGPAFVVFTRVHAGSREIASGGGRVGGEREWNMPGDRIAGHAFGGCGFDGARGVAQPTLRSVLRSVCWIVRPLALTSYTVVSV
jgi:hypothetical protein